MARYVVHVRTQMSADDAFAYMADLRNFAEWDPGVQSVDQVTGDGAGAGAVFDVAVDGLAGAITLRYVTTSFDAPRRLAVQADSDALRSVDVITVQAQPDGSTIVGYDAEVTLKGFFRLGDPLLRLGFERIGDKAAAGLVAALDGERVPGVADSASTAANVANAVIEAPVVPSFTKIGYQARRRLENWSSLDTYDLSDRVIVITGATSGLGKAAALQLAECGATLVLVGRTAQKNELVVAELVAATGSSTITQFAADMGNYDDVRALADHVLDTHSRLDVLIHNAGTLSDERRVVDDGTEATVASQVAGPFLLTTLLLDRLSESAPARVITMSSGGMYSAPLTVSRLEMDDATYKGAEQYARAKRAQVTLNQMWASRFRDRGVVFHAVHPGWADTPGVEEALPTFRKVVGPLLRSPLEGADTMVWLAADDEPLRSNGMFWHDRRIRSIHKLGSTRSADTPDRRKRLWDTIEAKVTYR